MDISKREQRILHLLAQGGWIEFNRYNKELKGFTRDGYGFQAPSLRLFRRMKYRKLIASKNGKPYTVTRFGLSVVRAQLDNR